MAASLALFAAFAFGVNARSFDPTQHLGGNSGWFAGPNVFEISPEPPKGCVVDQAAFAARHGSRFPDPGAYSEWVDLYDKINAQSFSTNASQLEFLKSWEPVLSNPDAQLSELSLGGWRELYNMGIDYRRRYPDFYTENTPFVMWVNKYTPGVDRVIDSGRLFARGYLGPNATTYGTIYALNQTDPRSVANSLAPSDLCPNYNDNGGGDYATTWADIYLPPIADRINTLLTGLEFNTSDVNIFPYLCGYETQITGTRSPWCSVFTEQEIAAYEYAQDIRYWYGTGLGTDLEKNLMLPFLSQIIQTFVNGPNTTYPQADNSTFAPNPLTATFANDGQISQLAAGLGVFDDQPDLPSTHILHNRTYRSTNVNPMRGTINFERMNCGRDEQGEGGELFMRIKLNDAVYPVAHCQSGPGRSCPLGEYQELIEGKLEAFGGWFEECGVPEGTPKGVEAENTFLTELVPWAEVVRP